MIYIKEYNEFNEFNPILEKIIKLPDSEFEKIKKLWDIFNKMKGEWVNKTNSFDNPYYPIQFRNFFQMNDMRGNYIRINVGVYKDSMRKYGVAKVDTDNPIPTILINLNGTFGFDEFENIIEHELIHVIDPKVNMEPLATNLFKKYGADPSKGKEHLDKYFKSPWEFDAYSSNIIRSFKNCVNKNSNNKKDIYNLISDIKNIEPHLIHRKWGSWLRENKIIGLMFMQRWKETPSLWKRFLQRLYSEIN